MPNISELHLYMLFIESSRKCAFPHFSKRQNSSLSSIDDEARREDGKETIAVPHITRRRRKSPRRMWRRNSGMESDRTGMNETYWSTDGSRLTTRRIQAYSTVDQNLGVDVMTSSNKSSSQESGRGRISTEDLEQMENLEFCRQLRCLNGGSCGRKSNGSFGCRCWLGRGGDRCQYGQLYLISIIYLSYYVYL